MPPVATQEAAIAYWRRVEEQNAAYLPLVAEKLVKAYETLGRPEEGVDLLSTWVNRYPTNDLLDVAFSTSRIARAWMRPTRLHAQQMQTSPNVAGMTRLLEAQVATAEEPRRSELELMRTLIRQRTKNLPRYTCQNCGFRARLFYWQCPGCSGWETYAPRRVEPITGV